MEERKKPLLLFKNSKWELYSIDGYYKLYCKKEIEVITIYKGDEIEYFPYPYHIPRFPFKMIEKHLFKR